MDPASGSQIAICLRLPRRCRKLSRLTHRPPRRTLACSVHSSSSTRQGIMNPQMFSLLFLFVLAVHGPAQADDTDSQSAPLGKVSFPTSCDPKVQPRFERAVAMLHSFWYSAAEKAFRDVLKDDPQCAI